MKRSISGEYPHLRSLKSITSDEKKKILIYPSAINNVDSLGDNGPSLTVSIK